MAFSPAMLIAAYDNGIPYDVVYDNSGPSNQVLYEGSAYPGTLISAGIWRIKKFLYDGNGQVYGWRWANGSTDWNKVWNDRATYTYTTLT